MAEPNEPTTIQPADARAAALVALAWARWHGTPEPPLGEFDDESAARVRAVVDTIAAAREQR